MRNSLRVFLMVAIGLGSVAGCAGNNPLGPDPGTPSNPSTNSATQTSTTSQTTQTPPAQGTADLTDCPQAVVADPTVSLAGVTLFAPGEKLGNPEAGEPSYVYLAAGTEGVILPGPTVTAADGLLTPAAPAITMVGVRSTSADGYDVIVNPSLKFHVAIRDFEFEVALARVELCDQSGDLRSMFVFKGNAGASGVAHDITITTTTTSKVTSTPSPVTVEVR